MSEGETPEISEAAMQPASVITQSGPEMLVGNLADPIKLTDVNLSGVAAEASARGAMAKIRTRLATTSDDPLFHRIVESLFNIIANLAQQTGNSISLDRASSVLLVIRPDDTADLWVDSALVALEVIVKRDMLAGTAVFKDDIADVLEMRFPFVDVGERDRVLCLFRTDWRFGLFFDFNPSGRFSVPAMGRTLGTLYRTLKYRHLYDMLADEVVFGRLTDAGWFPFVEIVGSEFKTLADACEAGFELDDAEAILLTKFDEPRIERMFIRWMAKPHFASRERILRSAVRAYNAADPVAVLKTVLTEIEGILADAHRTETGKGGKIQTLLKFAVASAERKAGAPNTLLFPSAFARYLAAHTFAAFDPSNNTGTASSRHAVGHGAARADSYTQTRALQAILALDQMAFYT